MISDADIRTLRRRIQLTSSNVYRWQQMLVLVELLESQKEEYDELKKELSKYKSL